MAWVQRVPFACSPVSGVAVDLSDLLYDEPSMFLTLMIDVPYLIVINEES